jgi:hypothetical protein
VIRRARNTIEIGVGQWPAAADHYDVLHAELT